jgi:hypothetical protein
MHRDLFRTLADGHTGPLRDWLSQHGVETSALWALPRWNADTPRDGVPTNRRPPRRRIEAANEVSAQLRRAARMEGGAALLLLYVMLEVEEAWEVSYHYHPLWDTLRGARDAVRDDGAVLSGDGEEAVLAVLALMESLDAQIVKENALTCGRLTSYARAADAAAAKGREAADLALRAASPFPELSRWVVEVARQYCVQQEATARAAHAITAFHVSGAPLDDAIADICAAERETASPRSRSELRAHRVSLMALNQNRQADWLRIDHGSMVYIYPFAIRGLSPDETVKMVGRNGGGWQMAGVQPIDIHESLDLDDVWDGSDSLARRYEGALVELPDVCIRTIDGVELERMTVQIRFSRLGNHYARFETGISAASPADLSAMLMRAAPEHGVVQVAFGSEAGDARDWPRLSDLAMQLVQDVDAGLERSGAAQSVRAVARPGMYHVVTCVNAVSRAPGPVGDQGRTEVLTMGEFNSAVGAQVLTNPVPCTIGSVAEWIRYPAPRTTQVDFMGHTADWLVRTCNTTCLVAPGTPMWVTRTNASMAEFVASLDGLFAGWHSELASHYHRVNRFQGNVADASAVDGFSAQALGELSRQLDEERIRLNDFAVEARSMMALIRSPSLVSSPMSSETLGSLLERSGYQRRVDELVVKIDEVMHEQLGLTIEKLARRRAEKEARDEARSERRQRAKLDTMLAVIAAVGVSGLGQILQSGYEVREDGALAIVVLIVLLAILVGGWFWRAAGRRD